MAEDREKIVLGIIGRFGGFFRPAQILGGLADTGQHLIEGIGQLSNFIGAMLGSTNGIILTLRHRAGHSGQFEDGQRDPALQAGRENDCSQEREGAYQQKEHTVNTDPGIHSSQVGQQIDRSESLALLQDGPKHGEMGSVESITVRPRAEPVKRMQESFWESWQKLSLLSCRWRRLRFAVRPKAR